jgi:DNA-binding transcriptional ArsR family regulator
MRPVDAALSALADGTRRAVLERLRGGRMTVGEIAEALPVSRPAVSQHLAALQAGGLVKDEWQGTRHYFSLDAAALVELRRHFEHLWRDALQAYARHVHEQEASHGRKRRR